MIEIALRFLEQITRLNLWGFSRTFFLFILISVVSIISYGMNVEGHHFYNLGYLQVFTHPETFLETPMRIILNSDVNKFLLLALSPVLTDPNLVMIITVLIGGLILFVAFFVVREFLPVGYALVFVSLCGMVAGSPIPGFVANELMFQQKTLTTLCVLTGILCYLRKYWFLGGLFAALGALLHPLNAISTLFFFFSAYFFIQVTQKSLCRLSRLTLSLVPILGVVTYSVISGSGPHEPLGSASFHEWYQFSLLLEADDVAMFWVLKEGAYIFIPLLLISFSVSVNFYQKTGVPNSPEANIHAFNLIQLPLIIGIVLFEAIQVHGLAIPILSEWFSTVQLRRGLWLPVVIGLMALFTALSKEDQERKGIFLLGTALAALLDHTLASVSLFLITVCLTKKSTAIRAAGIVSLGWCIGITLLGLDTPTLAHTAKHVVVTSLIVCMFFYVSANRGLAAGLVLTVALHTSMIATNSLLFRNYFIDSMYALRIGPTQNGAASNEQEALVAINNFEPPTRGIVLFAPTALGYYAQLTSNNPIFLTRSENIQMFRRDYFPKISSKLHALGLDTNSCGTQIVGSLTGCFLEKAQDRIDRMTLSEITALKIAYPIGTVVRRAPIEDKIPDKVVGGLYIYQLPELP